MDLSSFAVWSPSVTGTTWRLLQPAIGLCLAAAVALPLVRIAPPIIIFPVIVLTGAAGCFLIASVLAVPWELRFTARREVIFADTWLGVAHGGELDRIPYSRIGKMWAISGAKYPLLTENRTSAETGYIHVERTDGLPFSFVRVLTYTKRDRASFLDFVSSQAEERGLPVCNTTRA